MAEVGEDLIEGSIEVGEGPVLVEEDQWLAHILMVPEACDSAEGGRSGRYGAAQGSGPLGECQRHWPRAGPREDLLLWSVSDGPSDLLAGDDEA